VDEPLSFGVVSTSLLIAALLLETPRGGGDEAIYTFFHNHVLGVSWIILQYQNYGLQTRYQS
jgi:hypothetical protein